MKGHIYRQFVNLKKQFGPLVYWDIKADTLEEAHYILGERMRNHTKEGLRQKLATIRKSKLHKELLFAQKCRLHLENRESEKVVGKNMKMLLGEYLRCFKAWCKGAGIDEEVGFWLQNENICCQTGMLRAENGSIIAWHTEEEDPAQSYILKPFMANFYIKNQSPLTSFIHPFYLPGTGFSWQKDFFLAVNSFYLKYNSEDGGSLASVFSWMVWRLGTKANFADILKMLCPFIDGYSILFVKKNQDKVEGGIIEFGANKFNIKMLGDTMNDYLFLATIINQNSSLIRYQTVTKKSKKKYYNRKLRTKVLLTRLFEREKNITVKDILNMLASRWGNGFAYCNKDVKAHVVADMNKDALEIFVGAGPVLKDELPKRVQIS